MPVPLRLPRYTEIHNPKLRCTYLIALISMMVSIVVVFFVAEQYTFPNPVETRLRVSIPGHEESILAANATANVKTEAYLCPGDNYSVTGTCVGKREAVVQNGYNDLFLMTWWQVGQTQSRFLQVMDSVPLKFDFKYIVHRSPENLVSPWNYVRPHTWWAASSNIVRTVVLNHLEEEYQWFEKEEPIVLNGPTIVKLAQGSSPENERAQGWLDPVLRKSGVEIVARVTCKRKVSLFKSQGTEPWCELKFVWAANEATITRVVPTMESDRAELLQRVYAGLRVRCETGSSHWEEVSLLRIVIFLGSAIVYIQLPTKLLFWFTTTCLGHLSCIYKRCLIEPFNLVEDSANAALRMITSSVQFVELAQLSESDGITEETLLGRLQKIMKDKELDLDSQELVTMAHFIFTRLQKKAPALSGNPMTQVRSTVATIHKEVMRMHTGDEVGNEPLGIDAYSEAMSSQDKVNFASIIGLFDVGRPRSKLEEFFTPTSLARALCDCKQTDDEAKAALQRVSETETPRSLEAKKMQQWEMVASYKEVQHICGELRVMLQRHYDDFDSRHIGTADLVEQMKSTITNLERNMTQYGEKIPCLEQRWERFSHLEKSVELVRQELAGYEDKGNNHEQLLEKRLASLEENHTLVKPTPRPSEDNELSSMMFKIQIEHDQLFKHMSHVTTFSQEMARQFEKLESSHSELQNKFEAFVERPERNV